MTSKNDILSRFSDSANDSPCYLPDLSLWYEWHRKKGTLPDKWHSSSLLEIARDMGTPVWLPVRPWRVETPGVEVITTEANRERIIRSETSAGPLIARWIVGPDGAWWQAEYPVKTEKDLEAALVLVKARHYVLDPTELARTEAEVGEDGILAIEIPRRPISDVLHEILGWSDGLMFLAEPAIPEINAILEAKLQDFVREIAKLPGSIILSPDNLDGQFISPALFQEYLADSYRLTAEVLHQQQKLVLVHVGGPIKHLAVPLAETGIDGLEGVAGAPQSDLSLAEARQAIGPALTLWGGIPQDVMLEMYAREDFEAAVSHAVKEARVDRRTILGIADRVPVDAELERLEVIPTLIEQSWSG